jgi:ketosteroid isomerase-like protein
VQAEEDPLAAGLRAGIGRWNEGALDSAPTIWHEDIVWEEAPEWPDSGTWRGLDATVERMRERLSLLGDVKLEVLEVETRAPFAMIEVEVRGVGASSGAPALNRTFWVFEFARDDGRVIRWREFLDRGQAEAAFRGP